MLPLQANQPPVAKTGLPAAELSLRVFCESALELLPAQADAISVLADILPSFFRVLRDVAHCAETLRSELHGWEARSEQLIRLARLHGADVAEQLAPSVERTRAQAMRAIHALDSLRQGDSNQRVETEGADEAPPVRTGFHLRQFCEAVLELSGSESRPVSLLSQVAPSMVQIFCGCELATLEQMRGELAQAEQQGEDLVQLAASHSEAAACELRKRAASAWNRVASLLDAIDSLRLAGAGSARGTEGAAESAASLVDAVLCDCKTEAREPAGPVESAEAVFRLALRCHQRGEAGTAVRLYGGVLQLDPRHRLAYCQRGRIRLLTGDPEGAIADLTEAIRISQRDAAAFRWRGDAHAVKGSFAEAAADYARSLRIAPDAPIVRYNRAVVLRQAGELDRAWEELEQLLVEMPRSAPLHLNRGLIHLARGARDLAAVEFQRALQYQPDSREARERLAELQRDPASEGKVAGVSQTDSNPVNLGSSVLEMPTLADREPSLPAAAPARNTEELEPRSVLDPDDDDFPLLPDDEEGDSAKPVDAGAAASTSSGRRSEEFDDQSVLAILSAEESPTGDTLIGYSESETRVDLLAKHSAPARNSIGSVLPDAAGFGELEIDLAQPRFDDSPLPVPTFDSSELPAPAGEGRASAAAVAPAPAAASNQMSVICPGCGSESSIGWDRLQKGKVLSCPRCSECFTMQGNGILVLLSKSAAGKWVVAGEKRTRILSRRNVIAGVLLLAVGGLSIWLAPTVLSKPGPQQIVLPDELDRRAKVFGEAWLSRDYAVIDRLTYPEQRGSLFSWHRRHPAPESARGVTIEVNVLAAKPPLAEVELSFAGVSHSASPLPSISQQWREHRGEWLFAPAGGTPAAAPRPRRTRAGAMSWLPPRVAMQFDSGRAVLDVARLGRNALARGTF